ncbi:MAG: hypothetical protein ACK6EB_40535, partial [Planctomyces sp.]
PSSVEDGNRAEISMSDSSLSKSQPETRNRVFISSSVIGSTAGPLVVMNVGVLGILSAPVLQLRNLV